MSSRSPYLVSSLGHVVVVGALLTLTTLQRAPEVIPSVRIITLPGSGSRGGRGNPAPALRQEPRPPAAVQKPVPPPPVERPKPEVLPAPKSREKPEPKRPVAHEPKPAQAQGALPAKDPGMVSKVPPQVREATVQPATAPGTNAAAAATGAGSETAGTGSGKGIGVEAEGDEGQAPWYWIQLRDRIAQAWGPPPSIGRSGLAQVKVHFTLSPQGGAPAQVEVRESSRVSFFDRAAMRAVLDASPLPPLPPELGAEPFGITLTFHQQY